MFALVFLSGVVVVGLEEIIIILSLLQNS